MIIKRFDSNLDDRLSYCDIARIFTARLPLGDELICRREHEIYSVTPRSQQYIN